ncbi:MAG: 50S ribosomal protein L16 [Candidatus Firestonebacteria bacterium]
MLFPRRIKYRRSMRGRMKGISISGSSFNFGEYGLKALQPAWVTDRQIESSRVAIVRSLRKGGKLWIKIFPNKPISQKPAETRMGGGKPGPSYWVAVVRPGIILFEIAGVSEEVARGALKLAAYKLPIKTKFVKRTN